MGIEVLMGAVLTEIIGKVGDEKVAFWSEDGRVWVMYHDRDCCEDVYLEDIAGDLEDLIGSPILMAEEVSMRNENPVGVEPPECQDDSFTWTFYKLATVKGYVTLRWYGESNGYYGEDVEVVEVFENKEEE